MEFRALTKILIAMLLLCAFAVPLSAAPDGGPASASATSPDASPETAPGTSAVAVGATTGGALPDTSNLVATGSSLPDGPIGPEADTAETLSVVVQLLKAKKWTLAIGAILMLLLSLTKQWWSFVPKAWKPHFVAATSGLSVVASGILAGMPVVEALWAGAQVAAFTGWLYGLVKILLKKFMPGAKNKNADAEV